VSDVVAWVVVLAVVVVDVCYSRSARELLLGLVTGLGLRCVVC